MTLPTRDQLLTITPAHAVAAIPLTHDENDASGQIVLTRAAPGAGHYCTAAGWSGNGVDSRLMCSALPDWLAGPGLPVSLAATIRPNARRSSRDSYVSLTNASDSPKLEICAVSDASDGTQTQMALRVGTALTFLARPTWRFAFGLPEQINGYNPYNQALLFLDASTLLVAAHFNDTVSAIYRFDLTTGECTGKATSTAYNHIGSLARDISGQVWLTCSLPSYANVPVDLDASFSSGAITAASRGAWSTPDTPTNGGITFVTVDSVEYCLRIGFVTSGSGWLYVFRTDQMSSTVMASDRVKRFDLGTYCQDICIRPSDGLLYTSRGTGPGTVRSFDITTAIREVSDGSALTPVATYPGPSAWTEGVDFHPSTGELWMSVEGLNGPGDYWSGSIWVSPLTGAIQENEYLIDFQANGEYQVRVNRRLLTKFTPAAPPAPSRFCIGGPPNVSPGWRNGFAYGGTIRNIGVKDRPFTAAELDGLGDSAVGESLASTAVPVVNPGAESVVAGTPPTVTDWTDESSGTVTYAGSSGPAPFAGAHYFFAKGALQLATQLQDVMAILGTTGAALDALTAAGKVCVLLSWQQASYDGSTDPGGIGVVALDATGAVLATIKSTEVSADAQAWAPRTFSAQLPSGTRMVKLLQHATRTSGTNLDCYRDDIAAAIVVQS